MRKAFYFGFAALTAFAFTACQKEVGVNEPSKKMVTVTLTAQKAGDETKTAAIEGTDNVTYKWTDEDVANLKVVTVGVKDGKEVLTLVENPDATISSDMKTLTITATVEEMSTLRAAISGGWTNDGLKAKVMASQSPLSNNFDPNADVLVSEDVTVDGLDNALLTFTRPVAINKMTLKNMAPGEKVHEISITSDKNLVGYYDDGKMNGQQGANSITLSYDNVEVGTNGEFPVYFVTMPQVANTLTVVVKSDQYVYTKTFGTVNFTVGKFSKFGVKLPAGDPVVDTDYTGDWVITGVSGDATYAAQAFVSGGANLRGLSITLDIDNEKIESAKVDEIKMHFEKVEEGNYAGLYTIKDASGNYLYAAASDKNQLKGATTIGGADYYWSVEEEPDGTFTIKAKESNNRNLMRFNPNNGNPIFSCYANGQQAITIYPHSWVVKSDVVTYDFETVAQLNALATSSTEVTKSGKLTNAVVSFVPDTGNAIIKDETGSILLYKNNHNLLQGQTFSGELEVKVKLFNGCAELTACNASFTGDETEVAPQNMTLSDLVGKLSTYQNAYVKVDDLKVSAVSGKNVSVTDGTNTYVVYSSAANAECVVNDIISVVGTIAHYGSNDQIKAWSTDDITVTGHETPILYTITVADSENGTVVASAESAQEGAEITLTITPATGFELDVLTVTDEAGAAVTVANNKFTMPASDVTVAATFKEKQWGTLDPETLVFSEKYNEDTELDGVTLSGDNYSISFAIGSGTSVPKYFKSGSAARIYGGNTITIDATSGDLTTIVFTCNTENYASILKGMDFSSGSATSSGSVVTWTGEASTLTITNKGTSQTRISQIEFNY